MGTLGRGPKNTVNGLCQRWLLPMSMLLTGALGAVEVAQAQVQMSFGVSLPGLQIGINVPEYPRLVRVPGYPVYYDPQADNNYFFYDGQYWVFRDDTWYQSSWYNGPWQSMHPDSVPLFVLRVPVRYYRQPPPFFQGWRADAPPRWGERFGRGWQQQHNNWERWDRRSAPPPAPLPTYQRQFRGDQYPQAPEHQQAVREQNYRYRGRDAAQPARMPPQQPQPQRQQQQQQQQPQPQQPQPQRAQPHPQPPPQAQPQRPQPQPQPPPQRAQPQPAPPAHVPPPAPDRGPSRDGPPNNPGPGRGQDRGPDRGGAPERGGQPGRGERPDKEPR
jgi:hypothetical protein